MIKLVITDFDNTLYDWVDYYVPCFNAMVEEIVNITNLNEKEIRQSFKRVHQKHKTSEYSFAIEELDILDEFDKGLNTDEKRKKYDSAIEAFRRKRKETLKLYESVIETLTVLKNRGVKVVIHTESMMFYASFRIKSLGLENLIDGIVALNDHDIPNGVNVNDITYIKDNLYLPDLKLKEEYSFNVLKPDTKSVFGILKFFKLNPTETLYVGDSLSKDVLMAQNAGIYDVFAAYGRKYNKNNYQQLIEITHWTEEDVTKSIDLSKLNIHPSFTIHSFKELIGIIDNINGF